MKTWIHQHGAALSDAVRRARHTAPSFLFNAIVIAAVLALPFAGLTLLDNLLPVTRQLAADPEITVFLAPGPSKAAKPSAREAEIRRVARAADSQSKIQFIPRDEALENLQSRTSLGEAVAALGDNPLPDAYVVSLSPAADAMPEQRAERLAAELAKIEGVEHVQVDSDWIGRLAALTRIFRLALAVAGLALAVVVVAVVFNTVRLQVMTQRDEIEICRLFGATDAFVSRPFYYAGAILGLLSGGLALAAVAALLPGINHSVAELARLYGSEFRMQPLGLMPSIALLCVSAALGYLGAGMSVRRHLKYSPD